VAAYALAGLGSPRAQTLLWRALDGFAGPVMDAVVSGLERADLRPWSTDLTARLRAHGPARLACARLLTTAGVDPGPALLDLLNAPEPATRAAGLRLAAFAGADALGYVEPFLRDPDPDVRADAVGTGITLGSAAAWRRCLELCAEPDPTAAPMLRYLAMSGQPEAYAELEGALAHPALRGEAVFAFGLSGRIEAAERLLTVAADPALGAEAADGFCAITGLDLAAEGLALPRDDEDEAPSGLARPDVPGLRAWWTQHRTRFPAARLIRGQPATVHALVDEIAAGPARWRHERARELAIRSAGACRIPTRHFSGPQRRTLEEARARALARVRLPGWAALGT
jgi:uncharacterized protein (TIGR02270 family)